MLVRIGAKEGSQIIMTPRVYMTTKAWEEMDPKYCFRLQKLNRHIVSMPEWWMIEIINGFGAHLSSYKALKIRHDLRILTLKEEGYLSHVNQAYDKFVAKTDKMAKDASLGMLRNAKYVSRGFIDQCKLVHIALYAVRSTKRETCQKYFSTCNLNPFTRIYFTDW